MEALGQAIGGVLSGLPPMMGAGLIILCIMAALVWLWKTAGRDAKREREAAQAAREGSLLAQIATLSRDVDGLRDEVREGVKIMEDVKTSVAVLVDRRR